jgi:uncharacterized membrane protein
MKKLLTGVVALGAVLYPLVVYFGLTRFQPRYVALFVGFLLLLRLVAGNAYGSLPGKEAPGTADATSFSRNLQVITTFIIMGLVAYVFASNRAASLKLYPVVVSFSLLLGFAWSLLYPPSVIERIARISEPQLPAAGVRYTRKITLVWCVFFLCNGLAALYTAVFASFETWALYNGLIAYALIACLLGGELLYRHVYLKKG